MMDLIQLLGSWITFKVDPTLLMIVFVAWQGHKRLLIVEATSVNLDKLIAINAIKLQHLEDDDRN